MNTLSAARLCFWINLVAFFVFSYLFATASMFTVLKVESNFTILDRSGAINAEPLKGFHPSYGFGKGNIRTSVPRFIAGPALNAEKQNALIGVCLAFFNAFIAGAAWLRARKTQPESETQHLLRESS